MVWVVNGTADLSSADKLGPTVPDLGSCRSERTRLHLI